MTRQSRSIRARNDALKYVRHSGTATIADVAKALSVEPWEARNAMNCLLAAEWIRRADDGVGPRRYAITVDGMKRFNYLESLGAA